MTDDEITRVLEESLSVLLTPEELADLRGRIAQQEEMVRLLLSLPPSEEDPYWPPGEDAA